MKRSMPARVRTAAAFSYGKTHTYGRQPRKHTPSHIHMPSHSYPRTHSHSHSHAHTHTLLHSQHTLLKGFGIPTIQDKELASELQQVEELDQRERLKRDINESVWAPWWRGFGSLGDDGLDLLQARSRNAGQEGVCECVRERHGFGKANPPPQRHPSRKPSSFFSWDR